MILKINNDNKNDVLEFLKSKEIEHKAFNSAYECVCEEEVDTTLDYVISDIEDDDKYNEIESKKEEIINELTNEFYNSSDAGYAFEQLAEACHEVVKNRIK